MLIKFKAGERMVFISYSIHYKGILQFLNIKSDYKRIRSKVCCLVINGWPSAALGAIVDNQLLI